MIIPLFREVFDVSICKSKKIRNDSSCDNTQSTNQWLRNLELYDSPE